MLVPCRSVMQRARVCSVAKPHVKRQNLLAALRSPASERQRLEALLELRLDGRPRLPPALRALRGVTQGVPPACRSSPWEHWQSQCPCPGPNLLRSGDISTLLRKLLG